jgi:hypothetical protein
MKQKSTGVCSRDRFWLNFLHGKFTIVTNLNTYMLQLYLLLEKINLDIKLKRNFIQKQSHWLVLKRITN